MATRKRTKPTLSRKATEKATKKNEFSDKVLVERLLNYINEDPESAFKDILENAPQMLGTSLRYLLAYKISEKSQKFCMSNGLPYLLVALGRVNGGPYDYDIINFAESLMQSGAKPEERGSAITSPKEFAQMVANNFPKYHSSLKELFDF